MGNGDNRCGHSLKIVLCLAALRHDKLLFQNSINAECGFEMICRLSLSGPKKKFSCCPTLVLSMQCLKFFHDEIE